MNRIKSRKFILLTSSRQGIYLAKGFLKSGYELIGVGVAYSLKESPIGLISASEVLANFGSNINIVQINLDNSNSVTQIRACNVIL